jgi:hypothetical protein
MAEQGGGAAGEDGGHPVPIAAQASRASREYAAMDATEAMRRDAMIDRAAAQAQVFELSE